MPLINELSTSLSLTHLLIFVEILLACGCASFLLIGTSTRQLVGLRWLSASFGAAAFSAVFLAVAPEAVAGIMPDFLVLFAFVMFHVAVLELAGSPSLVSRLGGVLLAIELIAAVFANRGFGPPQLRSEVLALLLAVQCIATAMVAGKLADGLRKIPAWTVTVTLSLFAIFNLARFGYIAFPDVVGPYVSFTSDLSAAGSLLIFLGVSLGFFWLTTNSMMMKLDETGGTDHLTRALNRRHFLRWSEQECERSKRSGVSFAVLMVDIDHFKKINDTFGHSVGDSVICDVVDEMRDAIRGIDVLGRWGGEEFVVLLRDSSLEAALITAERLRAGVENMDPTAPPLRYGPGYKITISVGVVSYRPNEPIVDLLARADTELYRAKTEGRNRVCSDQKDLRNSGSRKVAQPASYDRVMR